MRLYTPNLKPVTAYNYEKHIYYLWAGPSYNGTLPGNITADGAPVLTDGKTSQRYYVVVPEGETVMEFQCGEASLTLKLIGKLSANGGTSSNPSTPSTPGDTTRISGLPPAFPGKQAAALFSFYCLFFILPLPSVFLLPSARLQASL